MNIKRLSLAALGLYAVLSIVIVTIGFFFSESDSEQTASDDLVALNARAQQELADGTVTVPGADVPTTAPLVNPDPATTAAPGAVPVTPATTAAPAATPAPTPVPAATACGQGGPCTAADVAAHSARADCWIIYKNKVYDVSAEAQIHRPANSFDPTCGKGNFEAEMRAIARHTPAHYARVETRLIGPFSG